MTENPPPPPPPPEGERSSSDDRFDPRRPSIFPPSRSGPSEPTGCAASIGLVLLGFLSFVLAIGVFATVLATGQPAIGLGVAVATLVALFVIRKKSGPSPVLGAVIAGVSVAVVVFGGCMLILLTTKLDFK